MKCSLFLLTGACLGLILHPSLTAKPAKALVVGGGMPEPVITQTSAPPLLSVSGQGVAYVVSGGKITAFEVRDHKLTQAGPSLPIPGGPPADPRPFFGAR
jgi:hypothetical protein